MGIITEDPRPRVADSILSKAELVRPQVRGKAGTTVASGRTSLALQGHCLVYRSVQSGYPVATVIPLRSVESFCIRTSQVRAFLGLAVILLLVSAATGTWWYAVPAAQSVLVPNFEMNLNVADLYVTAVLLTVAMILLFVYLVFRRTELVVHTVSGRNSIQLPLSRRVGPSAEAFVAELEAHIQPPTGQTNAPPGQL
jgi:hypothetical protein